jgi:hypothetical protein
VGRGGQSTSRGATQLTNSPRDAELGLGAGRGFNILPAVAVPGHHDLIFTGDMASHLVEEPEVTKNTLRGCGPEMATGRS